MKELPEGGSPLRRLLRQGGIYAIGNVAIKASGLLLAPLYLNEAFFSQVDFGQLVILEATAQLLIPTVGLGLATGMLKFMSDPDLERDRAALPLTTLLPTMAMALAFAAVLWPFGRGIAGLILSDPAAGPVVRTLLVYIALKVVGYVPLTLIRLRERAGLYVTALLAETLALIGGVYVALVVQQAGLQGVMLAYAVSAGASTAILTAGMLWRIEWRFRPEIARKLVAFGAPLAAAGIALPILHVGDRYIMEWLSTTEEVAVYGWAARLSGILNMLVVQSFQLAFAVIGIKELGAGDAGVALHRRAFRHYCVWAGWAALALSLIAHDVTALLSSTESYLDAAPMVLPLTVGLVFYGLYVVATNILYAEGKTRIVASSVFVAAVLNIALNIMLIPPLGGMGAALATLASYGALGLIALRISERYRPAGYRYQAVVIVGVAVGMLWFAGYAAREWALVPRLAWHLFLLVIYPAVILLTRVYSLQETRDVVVKLRRRVGR